MVFQKKQQEPSGMQAISTLFDQMRKEKETQNKIEVIQLILNNPIYFSAQTPFAVQQLHKIALQLFADELRQAEAQARQPVPKQSYEAEAVEEAIGRGAEADPETYTPPPKHIFRG